jgi:hypothetical protein
MDACLTQTPGPNGPIAAAAEYLGLREPDLRARLASGWSLGEVALDAGRTAAGLERALLADLERHLDADVAAGRVPPRRRPLIASAVRAWIVELVERRSVAAQAVGRTSRNRAPAGELSAVARPPWASAASRTIASPRPAPGFDRAVAAR